jgi:N-acetylglucosaminyldiphosphoundecaprenol N-acetyl-beta-D-mannosaminyltransferase
MQNRKITLMGIPIDNLTLEATAAQILNYINNYPSDKQNRYVSTLNVDFLTNTHSWNCGKPRYPELLSALRNSDVVTPDGMPILWLSRLMGCPLKERVAGTDLFSYLLDLLSAEHKKIFILGGRTKTAKVTGILIEALYPGLTFTGIMTPKIDIEGPDLDKATETDRLIVEHINEASPDLLFIALGNPKQEIWFNRVRHMLRVPVSMGIGGSIDICFGPVGRAPSWMQKSGLEWLYRLLKEPRRLWQRYILGGFKFVIQSVPLVICHGIARGYMRIKGDALYTTTIHPPKLFLSDDLSLAILPLPTALNYSTFQELMNYSDEASGQDATIIDFSSLGFLSLNQLCRLVKVWNNIRENTKQLFAIGISRSMRLFLKIHRLWDLFAPYSVSNAEHILSHLPLKNSDRAFFLSVNQTSNSVTISLLGALKNDIDYDDLLFKLHPYFHGQECLIDMSYCSGIDSYGLGFLLELRNYLPRGQMKIINSSKSIKRLLKLAKIRF